MTANKLFASIVLILILLTGAYLLGRYFTDTADPPTRQSPSTTNRDTSEDDQVLFVPEGFRYLEDRAITIDVAALPGELAAIWIEYGVEPEALSSRTVPMSAELGLGTPGEYGSYAIMIPSDGLSPGAAYFYRVVGETTAGETLRSGLNRFSTRK